MNPFLALQLGAIGAVAVATVVLLLLFALALRLVALVGDAVIRGGGSAFARWQRRAVERHAARQSWQAKG